MPLPDMEYQNTIEKALRGQREYLLAHYGKVSAINQKTESAVSIVTEIDIEIEKRVSAELAEAYPHIPFVGEECGGNREAESYWLMDPIDGTQHYMRGLPFATCMLALVKGGNVEAGAIYDFVNDVLYYAEAGKGAWKNGERMSVSTRVLKDSYVCWETHLDKPENRAIFDRLFKKAHLVKTICAGWELAMIADGKLDARFSFDAYWSDYDYAAGVLIAKEAGANVANFGTHTFTFSNRDIIVANPLIYKEVTEGPEALFPVPLA